MGQVEDFFKDIELSEMFDVLISNGFYHYLFPFLLVYAIVLTILNKAEIFKENKATRVIIALVFGLFSIAFPITDDNCDVSGVQTITDGCTLGDFMMTLFPGVTAFAIGILALYIVAAMLGVDLIELLGSNDDSKQIMKYILGALGFIVVVYYYAKGFGWTGLDDDFWLWELLQDPMLYMVAALILIFLWISSDDGTNGNKGE